MTSSYLLGFAFIQVEKGTYMPVVQEIKKIANILYALPIQGGDDIIVKFLSPSFESVKSDILKPICKIAGVLHTSTSFVFERTEEKHPNSEPKAIVFAMAHPFTSVDMRNFVRIPNVNCASLISGNYDFLIEVNTDEKDHLRLIIDEVNSMEGIESTETREIF
jgi:DNA-binding Lrp family transcriptional regulator